MVEPVVVSESLVDAASSTPNRGALHVFTGDPWSEMCDKTVVEPGGVFSPGLWTCGISVWLESEGSYTSADTVPPEMISSGFGAHGQPPIIRSTWPGGDRLMTSELVTVAGEGAEGCDFLRISVSAGDAAVLHVVVRGEGPAGSCVSEAVWDEAVGQLVLNGGTRITVDGDCAVTIRRESSTRESVDNGARDVAFVGSEGLVVVLTLAVLADGEGWSGGIRVEHGFTDRPGGDLLPLVRPYASLSVSEGFAVATRRWSEAVPAQVYAPDPAVAASWNGNAFHLLAGSELGIPRISPVDYPVLWIRDAVIQIKALDNLGRHDLARAACEHLSPQIFAGGFGPEADAPGQGIWALVSHAEATGDVIWLATVFPAIVERVVWLDRMRTATTPLRTGSANRMPKYFASPAINLVCLAARDGLIRGRMDWHYPDFYVNSWAVAGYRAAARAADRLGLSDRALVWSGSADHIEARELTDLLPLFGSNDRDAIVAPYPTGILAAHRDVLRERFKNWYERVRLDAAGRRIAEPLWTYFEAAQAHNAIELGWVNEAWVALKAMIDGPGPWKLHAFGEGEPGGNEAAPFGGTTDARGWLNPTASQNGNMPHGWTNAEMINAIRAVLLHEADEHVILGPGVPLSWWADGASFGVVDMPTRWGPLTYTAVGTSAGRWEIHTNTTVPWRPALALPVS